MEEESEYRPSITKVWAKNFRSIEFAELELDPLTVLVGPNASGKSNLMDILGFLGDAARLGLETATTRRGGIDSIGRKSPTGRVLGPEIGVRFRFQDGTLDYTVALTRKGAGEYQVKRESAKLEPTDSGVRPLEVSLTNGQLTKPKLRQILEQAESTGTEDIGRADRLAEIVNRFIADSDRQDILLMSPEPSPLPWMLGSCSPDRSPGRTTPRCSGAEALNAQETFWAESDFTTSSPTHSVTLKKWRTVILWRRGAENLASTLRDMIQRKSCFLQDLKGALTFAVPGVRDIRVSHAGSFYVVELNHERNGGNERGSWFDLSHESDGTIRLLALLTALFQDPAPSLIGLEEPELAIHPGAMAVLSDNMREAALRGQVLVATHNPDLIDRLPIESIRAVTAEDGSTRVGRVTEHQLTSVTQNLFTAGELHSMEGLQPAGIE